MQLWAWILNGSKIRMAPDMHFLNNLGLTPLDIMFSRPGGTEIKMCDFSLSRRIVGIVKMEYGQPEYVAPEIVNGEGASFASDLWAVGIITYLLLSGVSPFRGQVCKITDKCNDLWCLN